MKNLIIGGGDTETTGFLEPDHRFVELYTGLWRNGKKIFEFERKLNPERSIPLDAQRVHGITLQDVMGAQTWEQVAKAQHAVISKCDVIVFHNAEFDWNFYKKEFERIGMTLPDIPVFDTMTEGVWATPDGKRPSLEELCLACDVEYDKTKAHAAHYDVDVMMECFLKALDWGFYKLPERIAKAAQTQPQS